MTPTPFGYEHLDPFLLCELFAAKYDLVVDYVYSEFANPHVMSEEDVSKILVEADYQLSAV